MFRKARFRGTTHEGGGERAMHSAPRRSGSIFFHSRQHGAPSSSPPPSGAMQMPRSSVTPSTIVTPNPPGVRVIADDVALQEDGDSSPNSHTPPSSPKHLSQDHLKPKLQNRLITESDASVPHKAADVSDAGNAGETRALVQTQTWPSRGRVNPGNVTSSQSRVVTLPTLCRVDSVTDRFTSAVDLRGYPPQGAKLPAVATFPSQRVPRILRVLGIGRKLVVEGLPYGDRMSVLWATDVLPQPSDPYFPCVETETVTIEPVSNGKLPGHAVFEFDAGSNTCGDVNFSHSVADSERGFGSALRPVADNYSDGSTSSTASKGVCTCADMKTSKSNFVYQGDQWEVLVQGMHVENFNKKTFSRPTENGLILYSMEAETGDGGLAGVGAGGAESAGSGCGSGASSSCAGGGGSASGGRGAVKFDSAAPPVIHYDFKKDGVSHPDTFRAVPSSKALVTNDCGRMPRKTVKVRFVILEVDKVSDSAGAAVEGVEALTSQLAEASLQMPYASVLTPAMRVAGKLGQSALELYAKPDHVISIDMSFRVLQRGCAAKQRSGDYLRYGYMFFLSKAVSYKLYAATRSSTSIRLMMRDTASPAVRPFVPLTHVSYLVLKVGVPSEDLRRRRRPLGRDHARRLQDVCENVDLLGDRAVCQRIRSIMSELNGDGDTPIATHAEMVYNAPHKPPVGASH